LTPIKSTINDDPCDFDNKPDSQSLLCNTSSSHLTEFDCSISLIDEVKKLGIQASHVDLGCSLNSDNADRASSSNIISKLDSASVDQKWQCLVSRFNTVHLSCLTIFIVDVHL
jgi:hypothetical protein